MGMDTACYIYAGNGLTVRGEDLRRMTHLCVAFGTLQRDGGIRTDHLPLREAVRSYRRENPSLRVLLSIGSGCPEAFSGGAASAEGRGRIARECARVAREYELDGVDLDWEYPCCPSNRLAASPADRENFTLLCRDVRRELGGTKLLTIAAGGGAWYLGFTQMDRVQEYLDRVFLMTYDLRCGFHSMTGHHTNLYPAAGDLFGESAAGAVDAFLAAGVPAGKLLIGAAFYSRRWTDVPDWNGGFLQYVPGNGGYGPDYTTIRREYLAQGSAWRYTWDGEAHAPFLYDGQSFISYDDPRSVADKREYARSAGLAGIFAWEYNNDRTGELLAAMAGR